MLLVESVTPQSHFSLGIWDVLKRTRSRFVTQHDAVVADPWRCLLWSGSRVPGLSHDLGFCASLGSCVCNLETWTMNSSCMQFWSLAMSAPWCTNRVAVRNGIFFLFGKVSWIRRSAPVRARSAWSRKPLRCLQCHCDARRRARECNAPTMIWALWRRNSLKVTCSHEAYRHRQVYRKQMSSVYRDSSIGF